MIVCFMMSGDTVSLLFLAQNRGYQVARLVAVSHSEIKDLANLFGVKSESTVNRIGAQQLNELCAKILNKLRPGLSNQGRTLISSSSGRICGFRMFQIESEELWQTSHPCI